MCIPAMFCGLQRDADETFDPETRRTMVELLKLTRDDDRLLSERSVPTKKTIR